VSRAAVATALVFLLGLALRALAFPGAGPDGSDCDGAAYLELARHLSTGAGYVTNAVYHLWNASAQFPRPESLWNPLYPHLVALASFATGDPWVAGKLVSLAFGAALPPLALLLGRSLTGRWEVGVLAGVFAAIDPTLVLWSSRALTECGTVTLGTAALVLAFRREAWGPWALGAVMGLAYLQKYQSFLLWIAVAPIVVSEHRPREAARRLAIAAGVFAAAISPWLVRNALVFGNPFHSDIRWNVLGDYPAFGGSHRFWADTTRPPEFLDYALAHPGEVLSRTAHGLRALRWQFLAEHVASPALVPLAAVGLVAAWRRRTAWLAILAWLAALAALSAMSLPRARFLLGALPLLGVLAAAGLVTLHDWTARAPRARRAATALLAVLGLWTAGDLLRAGWAGAHDRTSAWNRHYYFCAIEYSAIARALDSLPSGATPVIAAETSHGAWLLERPALRMPFSDAAVLGLAHGAGARWLVTTERDQAEHLPAWREQPPAWARVAWRGAPADYAPDAVAAGYAHLSPVIVYRLDPDTTAAP
jgi:hypothetical protein